MELIKVDPRALKPNPDKTRRTKAPPQADALLCASIKVVGIVEPPTILPETDGGNGYVIHFGHRRVEQAILAGLTEILAFRADPDDKDALRAIVENVAREPLNAVDLWASIERLVTQLFDLTPSEAHLATLLATGSSLSEAADKLGLTENTVRTYCKTILNKVGVRRQTELVRLILRSVAVLG